MEDEILAKEFANSAKELTYQIIDFFVKKFDKFPEVTVICALQVALMEFLNDVKRGRTLKSLVLGWNSDMVKLLENYEKNNL